MRLLISCLLCAFLALPALGQIAQPGRFEHEGRSRAHYVHVPRTATAQTPLVIALHGMGGNAKNLRFGLGLTEALHAAGFAVVYPQGVRLPQGSRHWNAGFEFMPVDDLGYLSALARHLIAEHGLAPDQTMIFGISMGGFMAYHMACHADLPIAAIAVVAGSLHPSDWQACPGVGRHSLLHIHGKRDPLIRYDGSGHWASQSAPAVGVEEVIGFWQRAMGARPAKALVRHDKVEEMRFADPSSGREVQLLALPAFGHDWPSLKTAGYRALPDIVTFLSRQREKPTQLSGLRRRRSR